VISWRLTRLHAVYYIVAIQSPVRWRLSRLHAVYYIVLAIQSPVRLCAYVRASTPGFILHTHALNYDTNTIYTRTVVCCDDYHIQAGMRNVARIMQPRSVLIMSYRSGQTLELLKGVLIIATPETQ
jgi:hypothetical protein